MFQSEPAARPDLRFKTRRKLEQGEIVRALVTKATEYEIEAIVS